MASEAAIIVEPFAFSSLSSRLRTGSSRTGAFFLLSFMD